MALEPLKYIISNKKTGYELHIFDCVDRSVLPASLEITFGKFCSLVVQERDAAEVKGSWVKIDKSVPNYKIGIYSDDAEKCRAVNELIRTDVEEMKDVRVGRDSVEDPARDDATSDNDVEVPTTTTSTTGDNEDTPVVRIDSEHPEGALLIQTDRTFSPEEHRKLKLYFSKMLARLYAGEDASLDSAWRTLQFHYDLVDDWTVISNTLGENDMVAFDPPSTRFTPVQTEKLIETFKTVQESDADYLRRAIVNAKANGVPNLPRSTTHSFAFSKPQARTSPSQPISSVKPRALPLAVASLATSPHAPNVRQKKMAMVLPSFRARQETSASTPTPSKTPQTSTDPSNTVHKLPEGSFAIDPALLVIKSSPSSAVESAGEGGVAGGDEEPIWEEYVSFEGVSGSQGASSPPEKEAVREPVAAQPQSRSTPVVPPSPTTKPLPETITKPKTATKPAPPKPKTKFTVNKSQAAKRVPIANANAQIGKVPNPNSKSGSGPVSGEMKKPAPVPVSVPSSVPAKTNMMPNGAKSFSALTSSPPTLKGPNSLNGNPPSPSPTPLGVPVQVPPQTVTAAAKPKPKPKPRVSAQSNANSKPRQEETGNVAAGHVSIGPVTPPPSPHESAKPVAVPAVVQGRQLAFASDVDAEDEDELPAVQTASTQTRTRKLAGTKRGREDSEGRTKRPVPTATPSLIQTRASARRGEMVEPAPASEGENDISGEEEEDAEEAAKHPRKRQALDDEEKGSRKVQPKRKPSTRGRKIVAPATASEAENSESGSDVEEPKKSASDSEEEEEVKAAKKKPRAKTATRRPTRAVKTKKTVQRRGTKRPSPSTDSDSEIESETKTKRRKIQKVDEMEAEVEDDSILPVSKSSTTALKLISEQTLRRLIDNAIEIDIPRQPPQSQHDASWARKREETVLGMIKMKTEVIALVGMLVKQGRI